jgi:hypothetical protein
METKVKKEVKNIVKGNNVKKEVSLYKLLLSANQEIKKEIYSLSGAIRNFQTLSESNLFLKTAKIDKAKIDPKFVLSNIAKVPQHKMIDKEVYVVRTIKGIKTDILKSKWSAFNVLQSIYYSK